MSAQEERREEESEVEVQGGANKKEIERKKNALRRREKGRAEIRFAKKAMCRTDT